MEPWQTNLPLNDWRNNEIMKTGFFFFNSVIVANINLKDDDDVKHVIVTNMQQTWEIVKRANAI